MIWHLFLKETSYEPIAKKYPTFGEWRSPRGYVIIAGSENEAREIAASNDHQRQEWWLNKKLTFCEQVNDDGQSRIIMADTPTG